MHDFKLRPDQTIVSELRRAIQEERKITLQILHLINEAQDRRLYASAGFSTPFEWLTKEFGYSAAAAMRRLDSARALREVPSIEKKIETGEVNFTNLAKVQSVIRSEEKRTGKRMDVLEKAKAFEMIETGLRGRPRRYWRPLFPRPLQKSQNRFAPSMKPKFAFR